MVALGADGKKVGVISTSNRDANIGFYQELAAAIDGEPDPTLKAQKQRLERLLTLHFDPDPAARVAAIASFGADLGLDLRATLNPFWPPAASPRPRHPPPTAPRSFTPAATWPWPRPMAFW